MTYVYFEEIYELNQSIIKTGQIYNKLDQTKYFYNLKMLSNIIINNKEVLSCELIENIFEESLGFILKHLICNYENYQERNLEFNTFFFFIDISFFKIDLNSKINKLITGIIFIFIYTLQFDLI